MKWTVRSSVDPAESVKTVAHVFFVFFFLYGVTFFWYTGAREDVRCRRVVGVILPHCANLRMRMRMRNVIHIYAHFWVHQFNARGCVWFLLSGNLFRPARSELRLPRSRISEPK